MAYQYWSYETLHQFCMDAFQKFGFSEKEATRAEDCGMRLVGLGKRILRTETASSFLLGCLVYEFEL